MEIIVPDGFLGRVEISEDRQAGTPPQFTEGRYIYTVPQSGRLVSKDIRPFLRWHTTTASFESGGELRVNIDSNPAFDGLMLTELATSGDGRMSFIVGSAEDVRRIFLDGSPSDP